MKILMCRPTNFSVNYSINPWMNTDDPVNLELAKYQWKELRSTIEDLGAQVLFLDQHKDLPDMVFAANAGIAHKNHVVISNFKHPERQPEHDQFKDWFLKNNYNTHTLSKNLTFEGGGDCFIWNDYLIAGWGFRSDEKAVEKTAELLNLKCITLKLQDERFYHLDTCMLEINGLCLYYPGAFDSDEIKKLPFKMIPISEDDAKRFACNGVKINNNIISTKISSELKNTLQVNNINHIEVDTSEFLKSGGSARCLVLKI